MRNIRWFFSRLFNSSDRDVEAHIVFSGIALIGLLFVAVWNTVFLKQPADLASFGEGIGWILGGGGVAAAGQGVQTRQTLKKAIKEKEETE